MDVLTPRSLDEALRLKAEFPAAVPIQGGTDVMVSVNFDRLRPERFLNLNEVSELHGWSRENGSLRLGAGLTYTEAMQEPIASALPALAEASRTVGSPQIRNRGTLGGNLGTASPAGDALPPLLVEHAELELASVRGTRRLAAVRVPRRAEEDRARGGRAGRGSPRQPERTAADLHEGLDLATRWSSPSARSPSSPTASAESSGPAYGSAGPVVALVTAPLDETDDFSDRVAAAASPIDDVRGSAAYRLDVLRVLTARALERCLA